MAMATPTFSPLPISHVKHEHASAMFSMESGGGLGLLDLLASVATQTLATDQSIQHIVTRPVEAASESFSSEEAPTKRKRASQQQQRRLMDHDAFDKEQLLRMAPASLLKLFAEQDFDEIRKIFRYRCFFNPDACSYENQSFGNEAKAKMGMKRHLLSHVQKVDGFFMAEPISARNRRLERAQSQEDIIAGAAYQYNEANELPDGVGANAVPATELRNHNGAIESMIQDQVTSNGSEEQEMADDNLECREQLEECDEDEASFYDKPFLDLKREVLERRQAFSAPKLFKENLNPVDEWLLKARQVVEHDHGPVRAQDDLCDDSISDERSEATPEDELSLWRRAVEEARRNDVREDFSVLNVSMMDVGYDLEVGLPWMEDEDPEPACDDNNETDVEFSESLVLMKNVEIDEDEEAFERRLALEAIKELQARGATNEIDGSFWCTLCSPRKQFTAYTTLLSHLRGHAGFRPYECRLCNAVFTRQHSLNYHLLIHSNATRFTCNDCGRKFRHPSHFKEHRRRHTGESPYLCGECSIRFKTRNTFKRHLKVFHGKLLTSSGSLVVLPPAEFAKVQEEERRREETRERKGKRRGDVIATERSDSIPKPTEASEEASDKKRRRKSVQRDQPAKATDDDSATSSMHEAITLEEPISPKAVPNAPFSQAFLASINGQQVLLIPKSDGGQTNSPSLPPLIPSEALSAPAPITSPPPQSSLEGCGQSKLEQCLRYGSAAVNTSTKASSGASVGQTFLLANPINIAHQNSVAQINSIRLVPVPEVGAPVVKAEQATDAPEDLSKHKILRVYGARRSEQMSDFLTIPSQS